MAKRKGKGPGRGRRGAAFDPATGRFAPKTPQSSAASGPIGVAPPVSGDYGEKIRREKAAAGEGGGAVQGFLAVPAGPTVTPQEIIEEVSGFRKAMLQTMEGLEGKKSQLQDALLNGLRKTAEELVQQNEDIFGTRYEKTIEQSSAYEIFENVVQLGEAAAKARTVEQKRSILRRLRTFKKVAQTVFAGGGKQGEIAQKLVEIIENIERPLAKEAGVRAAAKEKITDYIKMLPERMAAKIPLVGGMISRSLQRRREGKEEEAAALANLTEEISRAGRTSLYGRGGSGISRGRAGGGSMEAPFEGASTVAEMTGEETGRGVGFNQEVVTTLRAILSNVVDIRKVVYDQYDPATEELKNEENKRESENFMSRLFSRLRFGGGGGKGGVGGKGIIQTLSEAVGLDKTAKAVADTVANPLVSGTVGGGISGLIARFLGPGLVAALGGALAFGVKLAAVAAAIIAGLGSGTAVAAGVWAGIIDPLMNYFMKDPGKPGIETFTDFSALGFDIPKDRAHERALEESQRKGALAAEKTKYKMTEDPRELPRLVRNGLIDPDFALTILDGYEALHGKGADTDGIRQRIKVAAIENRYMKDANLPPIPVTGSYSGPEDVGPSGSGKRRAAAAERDRVIQEAKEKLRQYAPASGVVSPGQSNSSQMMFDNLEKSRAALEAEQMGPPAPSQTNVVAPTTNTSNTTNNFNAPSGSTRNNDPTLKAAERASM